MKPRIRDIVVLVAGLAVLLAVGPGRLRRRARPGAGVGREPGARAGAAAHAGARPAPPEPQYERWTVGKSPSAR